MAELNLAELVLLDKSEQQAALAAVNQQLDALSAEERVA